MSFRAEMFKIFENAMTNASTSLTF
jgi:hypothetical protein